MYSYPTHIQCSLKNANCSSSWSTAKLFIKSLKYWKLFPPSPCFNFLAYSNAKYSTVCDSWMEIRKIFISIFAKDLFAGDRNCPVLMHSQCLKGCSWIQSPAGSEMLQTYPCSDFTSTDQFHTCKQVCEGSLTSECKHIILLILTQACCFTEVFYYLRNVIFISVAALFWLWQFFL